MVDGRRGTMLRTVPVGPSPLAVAVDQPLRHAFVLNGGLWNNGNSSARSSVSLLDTRSGAVLHSVVVGRRADAIAIDARSGQAFVTKQWRRHDDGCAPRARPAHHHHGRGSESVGPR